MKKVTDRKDQQETKVTEIENITIKAQVLEVAGRLMVKAMVSGQSAKKKMAILEN